MKGNISCFSNQKTGLIRRQPNMNPKQFEPVSYTHLTLPTTR